MNRKKLYVSIILLSAFALWTLSVSFIDVKSIGPNNSNVGFATLNDFFHKMTGVHLFLYDITDWLSIIPLCFIVGFATLGLIQWIKRKSILKVDYTILILGGFYIIVMTAYAFFEIVVINYRPVLINGILEASYPSSTTMLVMCVMPTAVMQLKERIKNNTIQRFLAISIYIFTVFMVLFRIISGVHWLTDIISGALLSAGLVMLYCYISKLNYK